MKKIFITLFVVQFAIIGSFAQTPAKSEVVDNKKAPKIVFKSTTIDYGTIEYRADGVRNFEFTNEGKEPLLLSNVKSSCGCTVPTWPRTPIKKGDSGKIAVKYATNRVGAFSKTIRVTSNAKTPVIVLTIKGKVLPAPAAPVAKPQDKATVPTAQ